MEARVLVINTFLKARTAISTLSVLVFLFGQNALANDRQTIRLYKANKDGITQALRFTAGKARKPGCHNLRLKTRLFSAVQFGYETCHVYAKKSCNAESIMSFHTEKEPEMHTTDLSEGFSWYPVGEHKRGEKAKSWYCE